MRNIIATLISVLVISSCIEPIHETFSKLPPGKWRGVLVVDKNNYEVLDDNKNVLDYNKNKTKIEKVKVSGELPFNMNVRYLTDDKFVVDFINGDQIVTVDSIIYNRDPKTAKDTIVMNFPQWGTYIKAIYEENIMEGDYYVPSKKRSITFRAYQGQDHRFSTTKKAATFDITGKWTTEFTDENGKYNAIGEFKQDGNHLTGTFMSETGDYGFLEGSIEGNRFSLSSFDGTHAFLVEGKLTDENNIVGSFQSGTHYKSSWTAVRTPDAKLKDAYSLTKLKNPKKPMSFSFPDLDGNTVTLNDTKFKDKIKLVKISGSWCPNCKDESDFLKEYLEENPDFPIEVIEISFERSKDDAKNIKRLKTFHNKENVPFTVLYGGKTGTQIPQIERIKSYPTLFFVDKNNMIQKIHTGFSGPATSEYEPFKKEFDKIIKGMLKA